MKSYEKVDSTFGSKIAFAVRTPTDDGLRLGVHPLCAGIDESESQMHSPTVSTPGLIIFHILEGNLIVETEGKRARLQKGQFCLCDAVRPHTYYSEKPVRFEWVQICGTSVQTVISMFAPDGLCAISYRARTRTSRRSVRTEQLEPEIRNLRSQFGMDTTVESPTQLKKDAIIVEKLCSGIIQQMLDGSGSEIELGDEASRLVRALAHRCEQKQRSVRRNVNAVMRYICVNYHHDLNLDLFAQAVGMSKFQFIRSFEKETGVTPYAYVIQTRIDAAEWMLANTNTKIFDISVWCGFMNSTTFGVAFKKATGLTPGQYRSRHQFADQINQHDQQNLDNSAGQGNSDSKSAGQSNQDNQDDLDDPSNHDDSENE